jgi:ubiquinone/menaquinone biosynthesis C-methylase UbiE
MTTSQFDPIILVRDTYAKIADDYTKTYFEDFTDIKYIDKFLHHLNPNSRILDVGCGPGQFTKHFSSKGHQATGIDITPEMISIARAKSPHLDFQIMDMRKLSFPDSTFHGLFSAYSILHIHSQDIPVTLQEFHRVLKPQGFLCILVQVGESDQFFDKNYLQDEITFFNFFTNSKLNEYLTKAGFNKIKLTNFKINDPESIAEDCIFALYQKH